jgi:hypothetical protein
MYQNTRQSVISPVFLIAMMDHISNKVRVENKRTDIKALISADVFIRVNNEKETKLNQ